MKRAAQRARRFAGPDRSEAARGINLPTLLALRQGVAFIASPEGPGAGPLPLRFTAPEGGLVSIPASTEEIRAAEVIPAPDAASWPTVSPRLDRLAPVLSRLLSGDYSELRLQTGRDGLRATLVTSDGKEQPYPIAPKDALGFAAAVFIHAPRGVACTGVVNPGRVLLSVTRGARRHEYRLALSGVLTGPPPTAITDIGLSPSVLEMVLDSLDRTAAILLVSGGAASGRSTTLDLMGSTLAARGRRGGWIGTPSRASSSEIVWLADSLADWPFPESLHESAIDFLIVDHPMGPRDIALAAHLASSGRLVLASAPAADPEALSRAAHREMERGAAPQIPVFILRQALSRTVCPRCRTRVSIAAARARKLGFHRRDVEERERNGGLSVTRGRGCDTCAGTGASGLTGVFEFFGPDEGSGSLPHLREEGWRKALQGTLVLEDVLALPGAHRPMRTLREIQVHAGPSTTHTESIPAEPPPAPPTEKRKAQSGSSPTLNADAGAGPALAEAETLAELLAAAHAGQPAETDALTHLVASLCARAAGPQRLQNMLVASRGFHLSRHSVNTTLIALRIATALEIEGDPAETARCALLHDIGLLKAGVEPDAELVTAASEEVFDPSDCRLDPGPVLATLGCDDPALIEAIVRTQALLGFDRPPQEMRGRADHRFQAVALASLLELTYHGPARTEPFDLHDAASLVMEQHGRRFGPVIFRALLRAVPIFPIGSWVELSSGDLARVVSLNDDNHFRPRVELANGKTGDEPGGGRVVDLSRAPFLHIRQRVPNPFAATARPMTDTR
ncbi:MAG: HD domain-containing protein [Acidobacteriota bacterium]